MSTKLLLGIDVGLRRFGVAAVLVEEGQPRLQGVWCFRTEKSNKKSQVLASSDNVRRGRELWDMLEQNNWAMTQFHGDHPESYWFNGASCICCEAESHPRNASAAAKVALAKGILIAWSECHQIPLVEVSVTQIKMATAGKASASKLEVQEGVARRVGFENLPELLAAMPKGQREHAADAAGAVIASLGSDLVRMVLRC